MGLELKQTNNNQIIPLNHCTYMKHYKLPSTLLFSDPCVSHPHQVRMEQCMFTCILTEVGT